MPKVIPLNPDASLENADWAKRTPDTEEALKAGAAAELEDADDDGEPSGEE